MTRLNAMLNDRQIDAYIEQILENLPAEFIRIKQDLAKNLKTTMSNSFSRMQLVSREEFDVQAALLSRTRALLDEMEQKVERLEKALEDKQQEPEA